ncbi:MAG: hypothetical protein PHO67_07900 [Candidatus Omnitrophica bacterium]|nr:hypothetical protein [Candidatus Omnitrophota bacterium]
MAVCIQHKKTKKISRVSKAEAKKLFASGEYEYTSKSDWQRQECERIDNLPILEKEKLKEAYNGETEG